MDNSLKALTTMRFIAASIVVLFHFGTLLKPYLPVQFFMGPEMVSFFFVLSGFVMLYSHYDKKERFYDFYIVRLIRIYPVYILATFTSFVFSDNPLLAKFYNIFMLQSWFSGYPLSGTATGWSLSVEVVFYLMFPFILYLFKYFKPYVLIISIIMFYIIQLYLKNYIVIANKQNFDFLNYYPLWFCSDFLIGMLVGYIFIEFPKVRIDNCFLSTLLQLITFILIYKNLVQFILVKQILFAIIIYITVTCRNSWLNALLSNKYLYFLGECSYSLYIWQLVIFLIFLKFHHSPLNSLIDMCTYFVSMLFISIISYKYVECMAKTKLKRILIKGSYA